MLAQGTSATALEKSVINTFNQKLVAKAAAFASANSGASTYTYDSNAKVTAILNSPTSYGLVDATSYGDVVKDAWCEFIISVFGALIGIRFRSGTRRGTVCSISLTPFFSFSFFLSFL